MSSAEATHPGGGAGRLKNWYQPQAAEEALDLHRKLGDRNGEAGRKPCNWIKCQAVNTARSMASNAFFMHTCSVDCPDFEKSFIAKLSFTQSCNVLRSRRAKLTPLCSGVHGQPSLARPTSIPSFHVAMRGFGASYRTQREPGKCIGLLVPGGHDAFLRKSHVKLCAPGPFSLPQLGRS